MTDIVERLPNLVGMGAIVLEGKEVRCVVDTIESLRQQLADEIQRWKNACELLNKAEDELATLKQSQGEPVLWVSNSMVTKSTMPPGFTGELYTSAPTIPEGKMLIETAFLKMVSESLGRFVSDEGWTQYDMDVMDDLDAKIATAPKLKNKI